MWSRERCSSSFFLRGNRSIFCSFLLFLLFFFFRFFLSLLLHSELLFVVFCDCELELVVSLLSTDISKLGSVLSVVAEADLRFLDVLMRPELELESLSHVEEPDLLFWSKPKGWQGLNDPMVELDEVCWEPEH